ncbi:MAG TPA: histidinol dehydrogenase [Acidimicrobiia bacterium]|nr:histidinol dehydrogenase [Acidimicrobiia bacterium]
MLARVDVRGISGDLRAELARPPAVDAGVGAAVADILAAVRERGDDAVRELTARFDGVQLADLRVPRDEILSARDRVAPALLAALEFARDQIVAWHEAQREAEAKHERSGIHVQELVVPVDRAGCYVPGGRAPLASSVLMTALPARIAGVADVVLCSPPNREGAIADAILVAADLAQVDAVYRVGGAQAIGALAYGTPSIPRVDVLAGPGNAYVAEAKRQVAASGAVRIDGFAGPSEVAVIADATADPVLVAIDVLAQAEHGPGGAVTVITWDDDVALRVEQAIDALLAVAARRDEAAATLDEGGRIVLVESAPRALDASNAIAPEHLELMCAGAADLVRLVRHAGAVFVGEDAPAVIGDYVAGVNHVLPTAGTARFASALRVADFQKHVHVVTMHEGALRRVAPFVRAIAEAEGLDAHADAVRMREERS